MPKIVLLVLCLIGSLAKADVLDDPIASPYEENRTDSLHYRNPKGGWLAGIDFVSLLHSDYSTTSFVSNISASYGIFDAFLIGVSESYLFYGSETFSDSIGQSSGFSNPTVRLNYRYFGSLQGNAFGDISFEVSPKIGDSKRGDGVQKGNDLSGNTIFTFGTKFQFVLGIAEFNLGASAIMSTKGTVIGSKTAYSYTYKDAIRGMFELESRIHFCDLFFGAIAADVATDYQTDTSGFPSSYDNSPSISPAATLGWKFNSESLLYARYTYVGYLWTGYDTKSYLTVGLSHAF